MNPSIKVIPFPGIENAYVVISGRKKRDESTISGLQTKINVSFLWANDKGGCERDGEYGPLIRITPCEKDFENDYTKAQPHYFYDYITGYGDWGQLYVDESGIKDLFLNGDYKRMFEIMKRFTS